MAEVEPEEPIRLSAAGTNFLNLDPLPARVIRAVVPLAEVRIIEGTPVPFPIGTDFAIAEALEARQSLLVTARHNITERTVKREADLMVLFPKKESVGTRRHDLQGSIVTGVSMADSLSDVALLIVTMDEDSARPSILNLGSEAPIVGANCLALGYSKMHLDEPVDLRAGAWIDLSTSRGRIERVHSSGRDRVMVNFPAFRTNARYASGMSGGPVIGESGRVIGVVSTCMELKDDESVPQTSYSALIGGILELRIPIAGDRELSIPDLIVSGRVKMAGDDETRITRADDKVRVTWMIGS